MILQFGKYRGEEISSVPLSYVEWAKENINNPLIKEQFELEFQSRLKKDYNPLISGKNQTEGITNISFKNDKIYIVTSDKTEEIEYKPWVLSNKPSTKHKSELLKGNQYYRYITYLTSEKYTVLTSKWNEEIWAPRSIEEGFMMLHGYTYFKGMKINELSILSFDIEATTLDPKDPKAEVLLISTTYRNKDGSVEKKIFDKNDGNDIVSSFSTYCRDSNPDIILGHNILGYDLNYLKNMGRLNIGSDGSEVRFDDRPSKFRKDGSQQYEYHNAKVHGRTVVDTFFLSLKYDIGRTFPSYGLKQIEKHLGLVDCDRIEWDFSKYPTKLYKEWPKGKWEEFRQYCMNDSDSPIKMFDLMGPSFFYLNQSVPKTFQQMINEASGSQIDSMMIRSYLQDGYSQPLTSKKIAFEGAISMGIPGVYKNVRKADVSSLYPSIMLQYDIYDKSKDPNKHLLVMLDHFRTERLKNKELGEKGSIYHNQLSESGKIFINSTYGYLGAGYLLYNYPVGAAEVTRHGRELLLKGVEWATGRTLVKVVKNVINKGKENEEVLYEWVVGDKVSEGRGYTLSNVDTDSFSITNGTAPTKEEFKEELNELNSVFPDLITWADDGVYSNFIIIRAKNYVMKKHIDWCGPKDLDVNGVPKIKYKGSAITDQKKEPALTEFLKTSVKMILDERPSEDIVALYNEYCLEALAPSNIRKWCVKKTITKAIISSNRLNETKVLDACREAINSSILSGIQEGDKIFIYQTIDGVKPRIVKGIPVKRKDGSITMVPNKIWRVPELYKNDSDSDHYIARMYKTLGIIENIVDIKAFTNYSLKNNRKKLEQLAKEG